MMQARYFSTLDGQKLQCHLCPHECIIADDHLGVCGVRQNQGGVLKALTHNLAIAQHIDPIEKKPLYHVHPGSRTFSVAAAGCNFHCQFCQNHEISQLRPVHGRLPGHPVTAAEVVDQALASECRTIACTYTEPTVYYEWALDIARGAHTSGVGTVWVTNGFINAEPLREIAPFLLAANVDLKAWDDDFYRKIVGGALQPVLDTLQLMKKLGIWVEVTTLLVPGYCDDEKTIRSIADYIREHLGVETPWHISRFYPHYRLHGVPATPLHVLRRAREIGVEAGLRYVYCGNAPGDVGEHTFCYRCGALLIERIGFEVLNDKISAGHCPVCQAEIDGIGLNAPG